MFKARLAGDHLYGKWLIIWLSLVMFLIVSYFVLSVSHDLSWMRSGAELSYFLRTFLLTLPFSIIINKDSIQLNI